MKPTVIKRWVGIILGIAAALVLNFLWHVRPFFLGYFTFGAYGLTVHEAPELIARLRKIKSNYVGRRIIVVLGFSDYVSSRHLMNQVIAAACGPGIRVFVLPAQYSYLKHVFSVIVAALFSVPANWTGDRPFLLTRNWSDFKLNCAETGEIISEAWKSSSLEREYWSRLKDIGISRSDKIIVLAVRSPEYARQRFSNGHRLRNSDQSQDFRNSSLENYYGAIRILEQNGFLVVRIGSGLPLHTQPELHDLGLAPVDYANHPSRSDDLDLFLASVVSGAVFGGASGVMNPYQIFEKPFVVLNYVPLWGLRKPSLLSRHFAPKILRKVEDGKIMSLSESAQCAYFSGSHFLEMGIEVLENDRDLISDVVGDWISEQGSMVCQKVGVSDVQDKFERIYSRSLSKIHYFDNGYSTSLSDSDCKAELQGPLYTLSPSFVRRYPEWLS